MSNTIGRKLMLAVLFWPRWFKRLFAVAIDVFLCVFTLWLAFSFRLNTWDMLSGVQLQTIPVSLAIALPLFITNGLYRTIFRFIGWAAFAAIFRALLIYALLFAMIYTFIGVEGIPRTVGILQPMLLLLMVSISRFIARYIFGSAYRDMLRHGARAPVIIYGAGGVGRQLASALRNGDELNVKAFVDDDPALHGVIIDGIRVHNPARLKDLVERLDVKTVLLAIPSDVSERRKEIIDLLRNAHVAVRNAPNVSQLAQGRVRSTDLQELDLDDLLGRPVVPPVPELLNRNIRAQVVLVTGAGGSIGSEIARQICAIGPSKLVLFDASEFALYSIHNELSRQADWPFDIVPVLGSVRDPLRMEEVFATYKPQTVYHAAAYKHVPLVERNIIEGVQNNVLGTYVTARAAAAHGTSAFVLISTDKAVRPTNVMGASKRMAELVLQALAAEKPQTVFSMVRFGNVLGSSGSVVPLFRQQIAEGGPITVTHADVTRYFMTIPEAAQLVIQAGAMATGGDVFLLDMGKPVKIMDLARVMVELSGLTVKNEDNPEGDIEIVTTGLRPAEKLYEELLLGNDPQPTRHPRIMTAREDFFSLADIEADLSLLETSVKTRDEQGIKALIVKQVSGYHENSEFP